MIPGEVRDTILELQKYNLGSRYPPKEVSNMLLTEMRVPLVCHWNSDDEQWEVYREKDGLLVWQLSLPKNMNVLSSSAVKNYLVKRDSSKFGTRDDKERQKDFKFWFDHIRPGLEEKRKTRNIEEAMYKHRELLPYLNRKFEGTRQHVVPAGPVVGVKKKDGKLVPIRAFKKTGVS
jgi:hypothetical protein